MGDHGWKAFERRVAALIGGSRFWANSGEKVDCESDALVVQCKNVKTLSLQALSILALQAQADGAARGKVGIVAVKRRSGRGVDSPVLIVVTAEQIWKELEVQTR